MSSLHRLRQPSVVDKFPLGAARKPSLSRRRPRLPAQVPSHPDAPSSFLTSSCPSSCSSQSFMPSFFIVFFPLSTTKNQTNKETSNHVYIRQPHPMVTCSQAHANPETVGLLSTSVSPFLPSPLPSFLFLCILEATARAPASAVPSLPWHLPPPQCDLIHSMQLGLT